MTKFKVDYVIIGAGFYGLYAAKILSERGLSVLLIESSSRIMDKASSINQARIHNGYHYPRSYATAKKTHEYFEKFKKKFDFCLKSDFKQLYGIASNFSYTNAAQFEKFCSNASIPCKPIRVEDYFQSRQVEMAYEVEEYTYDFATLAKFLNDKLSEKKNVTFMLSSWITQVDQDHDEFYMSLNTGCLVQSKRVLNATYASLNAINDLFGVPRKKIKYELCEVALGKANNALRDIGITLMDGPFLSTMPFGMTGKHTLTSVLHTPHFQSHTGLPIFPSQAHTQDCKSELIGDCSRCDMRPKTKWPAMYKEFRKYFADHLDLKYDYSRFAIKAVLQDAEIDDKRPTLIDTHQKQPLYKSVFSGKINNVFDLQEELLGDLND
ncbi:FAD-binding oxidoreductase [Gammaproteobacteria bacterium]|nr:FAD-binding oxidoreductase [Gammaproteobacteria bacterium]